MATPEENFYRVCHIVLDAIPTNLRDLFIQQWNAKYPDAIWDNSPTSGRKFIGNEKNRNVMMTVKQNMLHGDCKKFDGTTLFSILLNSSEKFLEGQPNVETNIKKLRIIRNECFAHRPNATFTDEDYQTLITDVKSIFQQLGWSITTICEIEHKSLNTLQSKQLENALISEDNRNKSLESRMGVVEVKVDVVGEKLKSTETTKILAGANKGEIDLLKTGMASSNEMFETRMKLAEIEIHSAKEQLQSTNTEKIESLQSDVASGIEYMENRVKFAEARIDLLENEKQAGGGFGDFPWNLFKQVEKIDHGASGTVFKVTAKVDENVYALKQTHVPPNEKDFERCKNEIKVISQLENPYIVKYFTSFQDHHGKLYIQMDFCGKGLNVYLADKEVTLNVVRKQARRLLDQLLHGIDYIHDKELIHRDLKPSNILILMIELKLNVKIGDFGLVSFQKDEMTSYTGTPLYRAPEQEFNDYDNKVDMFTLGVVMFEVLKKKYDINLTDWRKYIKKLRKNSKMVLQELEPYEPKGWKQLISDLLERDPTDRPAAKYILDNLNSILAEDAMKMTENPEPGVSEVVQKMQKIDLTEKPLKLKPRRYQTELATPGLKGMNSIICAPTGCGKTIVAVMIVKHHIEILSEGEKPFKIMFLANDVRLVTQQKKCLRNYLPTGISIECMSGEDNSEIPFSKRYEATDVMVVTPQIVLNSLAKRNVQINQASLIIFDECHHTDKNHPYMEIMTHYFSLKTKSDDKEKEMPQIIGLSASIGVGSGKTRLGARDHVIKICGNLDAGILATVRENVEELSQYCNSPAPTVLDVPRKAVADFKDIFVLEVTQLMKTIEGKVYQENDFFKPKERDWLIPSVEKGSSSYTKWSRQLEDLGARELNDRIVSLSANLYAYNVALQLYDDLRLCDAQNHLLQFFNKETTEYYSNQSDSWLKNIFQSAMLRVKQYTETHGLPVNPKLETLSNYLLDLYKADTESKAIVFTSTRFHTSALVEWLKTNENLRDFFKPERLVGSHAIDDSGGITRNDQLQTLEKFKTGEVNILFATDAAREGIDIEDCNAVINYSHKTNVIGMVQKRGRARKMESEYVTIADQKSQSEVREKINIIHEEMMYEAISEVQQLQEFKREEYNGRVQKIQKDIILNAAIIKEKQKSAVSNPIPDNLRILCRKCSTFVFYASSLRTFLDSNHTSNVDFSKKYTVKDHPRPETFFNEIHGRRHKTEKHSKIFCIKCGIDWGVLMRLMHLDFPIMKICNFKLERDGQIEILKKWRDFPFDILDEKDIFSLHGMSPNATLDFTDSSSEQIKSKSSYQKEHEISPSLNDTIPVEDDVANSPWIERYPMNKNPSGICLILSNSNFKPARETGKALKDRIGAASDVHQLKTLFGWLKFKVEHFRDLTASRMLEILQMFGKGDHSGYDCFVCCILTHGSSHGLYGTDGALLPIISITKLYNGANCPSLGHKPKLFFLQCCRGDATDKGYSKDGSDVGRSDKQPVVQRQQIRCTDPVESDFFIGYPTPRGYVAWRCTEGASWYIDSLCEVFRKHAVNEDLLSLMTEVNKEVSKKVTPDDDRQMPEPTFTLRKKLYFNTDVSKKITPDDDEFDDDRQMPEPTFTSRKKLY